MKERRKDEFSKGESNPSSKGDENIKLEVERRMRNASYIFGIVKDREGDSGKKKQ